MLLGQAFSAIPYQRRFSVLSNLIKDSWEAKSLLKETTTLFGKQSRAHIIETKKSKKKLWECSKLQLVRQVVENPFQKTSINIFTKKSGGRFLYARKKLDN